MPTVDKNNVLNLGEAPFIAKSGVVTFRDQGWFIALLTVFQ